ncbi:MAG: DMT family transporter [Microbacterium sp.]|jgi:drug/metabolite transporter (DMT)-like permease|uniref:DMT family transporter n=1 Tax=Microbacterium sp. TaxID=51671 RepID=UPI00281DDE12|nr:DMT family transporter [Microbacterium sp.]MDR2320812.1 DMT family transporter [Microbacterium sp.]
MTRTTVAVSACTMVALYATNYALTSLALRTMSPFLLLLLRFALSVLVLLVVCAVLRTPIPRGRLLAVAAGAGLLSQGGQFVGTYWALGHGVGAGFTALVIAMNPVVTALLSRLILRRRASRRALASTALGAAAVIIACLPIVLEDPRIGPVILAVGGSLLAVSLGALWQGRSLGQVHPAMFTLIGVVVSAPVAGALALTEPARPPAGLASWMLLGGIVAIGLGGTVLYSALVRAVGADAASILFSVIPAATAVAALIVLGEPLSVAGVIGLALGASASVLRLGDNRPPSADPSALGAEEGSRAPARAASQP